MKQLPKRRGKNYNIQSIGSKTKTKLKANRGFASPTTVRKVKN